MVFPRPETPLCARRPAVWLALLLTAFWSASVVEAQRFSAPVVIPTGNRPGALLSADFTGKGLPELLALDAGAIPAASSVRVLAKSAGHLSVASAVATAGSGLLAMPAYPNDLPGLYWVSVSGQSATLYKANAQADGSYLPGSALTTLSLSGPAPPRFLLAAGGSHIGYENAVLLADVANDQLFTVLPNPDGTYAVQPVLGPGLPLLPGATALHTADLNGDGVPDLLVAGPTGVQVFLARSSGNSFFNGFGASTIYPCTGTVQSIALADMDGDAHPDLLVEGANGRIDIYHGNADGTFASTSEVGTGVDDAATGHGGHLIGVYDFNADGLPDLVLANPQGITVLLGTGNRNFDLDSTYAPGSTPSSFVFTDLNGDGKPDIAFDSPTGVTVLDSQGLLATVTTITDLVTPIFYGQEIGYTNGIDAVVSAAPADPTSPQPSGATLDGGLIYVYLDGQLACSLTVGLASPTGGPQRCNDANFQGYGAGDHTMIGAYQGNSYYAPSTSPTYTVQILPDDTATQVSTSFTPAPPGSPIKFTAAVTAPYATPTGTVQFLDGTTLLGTATLDLSGATALTTSALGLGTHIISANYIPTPVPAQNPPRNFNPSRGTVAQVVAVLSTTTLTSSVNPSVLHQPVTFTASVVLAGSSSAPSGSVTFNDGGTGLQTVPLNSGGLATYTTSSLAPGSHLITATFAPGTPDTMASSASLTQSVISGTDFTLTVTPANLSIGVGNAGTVTVAVTESIPLSDSVALSCAGLPWESTCTFMTAVLASGGGSTQLSIHPEAPHNCSDANQYFVAGSGGRYALALAAFTALLFGLRGHRFRRAFLVAAFSALPMLAGCGLGGHCTDLGTRPGDYTFTIIARSTGSTGLQHSQTVHMRAYLDGEAH